MYDSSAVQPCTVKVINSWTVLIVFGDTGLVAQKWKIGMYKGKEMIRSSYLPLDQNRTTGHGQSPHPTIFTSQDNNQNIRWKNTDMDIDPSLSSQELTSPFFFSTCRIFDTIQYVSSGWEALVNQLCRRLQGLGCAGQRQYQSRRNND